MQSHIFATIRGSSVAFILFLLSTALMAQSGVKIKEHVTISPTQKPLLSTASGGQFYITFQYTGELREGTIIWRDIIINHSEPCSTRYEDSSPLMTGQYGTRVDFYAATVGTATYQYFADGKLLKSITNTIDVVPAHVIDMKNFGFHRTFNFYKDSVVVAPGNMVEVEVYGTESVCEPNVGWSDSYSTTWTIVQGAEWGQFRDNYGNLELGKTCTRQPAEDGYIIHFQLVPGIPDSVSCIIIKAASDGVEKYKRIYLPRPIIKLTTQHTTLEPLGDSDNKGPRTARVIDYSRVKHDSVTISVKNPNGDPLPEYPFTLTAYVRDNSGGHDHTDNRPTGKFIHSTDTVETFSDKTGSDGKATYKYLCSGIGGVDSLYVKGKSDNDTSTALILLKMGDFTELTDGTHYDLVGSIDPHVKNHFGTDGTISALKEIADSVYAKFAMNIQYNDMSLIYGGPFDCSSNSRWNTPHQSHREGINVDVRPTIKLKWLQKIFERNNWGTILEEDKGRSNHHYHFTIQ